MEGTAASRPAGDDLSRREQVKRDIERRRRIERLSVAEILRLANAHEPQASTSPISYRPATCVKCSRPMVSMYHCWVSEWLPRRWWRFWERRRKLVKEVHLCLTCGDDYGLRAL